MNIAFHTPNLNFRGTCVALYDYAHYSERLLGHRAIIVTDANQRHTSDPNAVEWIRRRFPVVFYNSKEHLHSILLHRKCNLLYCIKYGTNDNIYFDDIHSVVHCVFDMSQPHGDVYAGVSKALATKFNCYLYVPHMIASHVRHRTTLRSILNIPRDVMVYGRHGGQDTFNLEFAKAVISRIVRTHPIHFVFMNAPKWDNHPQLHFLPATTDRDYKEEFINTCDAMIVPETMGHTFGMSIAEFSIRNKPVVCYNGPVWNWCHLDILGDRGIYFQTDVELYSILTTFRPDPNRDWNAYEHYTPHRVMKQFENCFLLSAQKKSLNL